MTNPEATEVPGISEKQAKPRRPAPAKASKARKTGQDKSGAEPVHSRVGHGWIWVALVAVAIASGGSVASLWYLEKAARHTQTMQLEAVVQAGTPAQIAQQQESQFAALDSRINALEHKLSAIPDLATAKEAEAATGLLAEKIDGLSSRVSELEKSPARLQAGPAAGGSEALDEARGTAKRNADELESLKERVAALEQAKRSSVSTETIERNQALVVAVGQLREALGSPKPFASELSAVAALGGSGITQITDRITPYADSGVATAADLREGFPKVAEAVMRAAGEPKSADWVDKAIARASSVVTVRKVGDVEGNTPEAVLARAEGRLANDDLDGALADMSQLTGAPAEAASEWLTKAQARVTADRALKDLHLQVIGQIAQSDGSNAQSDGSNK